MLLGVCGAMAGVYDGIVAVPRRSRALYVAFGHQHLQAAQAPPCFPPLVMPCHAARCKNVPYGPSCRPKRAVSRGAGACFVEHGVSASKQGGCGRGSVGAARHGPVAGIGETNMKKWVFVDRICRLERQLGHLLCIFALNTKIMRYEKGYVKNYIALRYGP